MSDMQLLCGDCLELMQAIPSGSIDMVLCDMPYGTTKCKWDMPIDLKQLWVQYKRVVKENGAILLFAQTPFDKILGSSNLQMLKYEWIWEKTEATGFLNAYKMPMKAHENILVFYRKAPTYHPIKTAGHTPVHANTRRPEIANRTEIYGAMNKIIVGGGSTERFPRDVIKFQTDKQKSHYHPTQKPVALCEYLIKTYTDEHDTVLDNCMGAGTTGVACRNLKRRFIGIELDPEYYEIAQQRINGELVG